MWLRANFGEPFAAFQIVLGQLFEGRKMRVVVWRRTCPFNAQPRSFGDPFEDISKRIKRNRRGVEINIGVHVQEKAKLLPGFSAADPSFTKFESSNDHDQERIRSNATHTADIEPSDLEHLSHDHVKRAQRWVFSHTILDVSYAVADVAGALYLKFQIRRSMKASNYRYSSACNKR